MDGFVYGAMVGLGFTVVEDVSYFINAVAAVPGAVDQSGPVLDTFLIRVVGGGLYGHVLFTGLTGTGFAYFVTQRAAPIPSASSVRASASSRASRPTSSGTRPGWSPCSRPAAAATRASSSGSSTEP